MGGGIGHFGRRGKKLIYKEEKRDLEFLQISEKLKVWGAYGATSVTINTIHSWRHSAVILMNIHSGRTRSTPKICFDKSLKAGNSVQKSTLKYLRMPSSINTRCTGDDFRGGKHQRERSSFNNVESTCIQNNLPPNLLQSLKDFQALFC